MKKRKIVRLIMAVGVVSLMASCGSSATLVDQMALLAYSKEPSQANLETLSKSYGTVINRNRKTGIKQPGVYSDYAVSLVAQGKRAEANNWFNKEMEAFPSSRAYVMQLKRQLIPEYQNDNSVRDMDASVESENSLSPAKRAAAEERAGEVMEESNKEVDKASEESNK